MESCVSESLHFEPKEYQSGAVYVEFNTGPKKEHWDTPTRTVDGAKKSFLSKQT